MKQKTAMMELKELVTSSISSDELGWWLFENMDRLLEKEKSQIINAYKKSTSQFSLDSRIDYPKSAEQYYNETYKHEA